MHLPLPAFFELVPQSVEDKFVAEINFFTAFSSPFSQAIAKLPVIAASC
jgi:hypothetical protein